MSQLWKGTFHEDLHGVPELCRSYSFPALVRGSSKVRGQSVPGKGAGIILANILCLILKIFKTETWAYADQVKQPPRRTWWEHGLDRPISTLPFKARGRILH